MTRIAELYGRPTDGEMEIGWIQVVTEQTCPYLQYRCKKSRKSQPEISIGTCSMLYGRSGEPILICPYRFLEKRQIFTDCFHLLTLHEPGNELHIVQEIMIPGGNVDYFLVSVKDDRVQDFVGIELQALDTTGTVWPERQRFLRDVGVDVSKADIESSSGFGMNWKMTAKTILVQLHHKVQTFEHISKKLVLVIQDQLLRYLRREFRFEHLSDARLGDSMQFHSYSMTRREDRAFQIRLVERFSTDAAGIAACLGLRADANVELVNIIRQLEQKISQHTLLVLV